MNKPAVIVRLEIERRPAVHVDTLDEGEELRLVDWLNSARPEYGELVARAVELAEQERAA